MEENPDPGGRTLVTLEPWLIDFHTTSFAHHFSTRSQPYGHHILVKKVLIICISKIFISVWAISLRIFLSTPTSADASIYAVAVYSTPLEYLPELLSLTHIARLGLL
jgi:hypothetical protein